ncbi:MAG TPA: HAD-IA family hydrolase [Chloroflexia bacterium]|nr:HAD-IA family hydrolase [Chloroflexia bacterium]
MLRGVLFDLGSTLQEYTHEDWTATTAELNRAVYGFIEAQGHAHRLPPLDEFLEMLNRRVDDRWRRSQEDMKGESMVELLDAVFEEHGISEVSSDQYLPVWFNGVSELTYVKPDVIPTLRQLREMGLKLGLVSNTAWPAAAHDPDLDKFGIKEYLDCRIYSCELGWEKPAPQIFQAALDCMGLPPEEIAFVGDFLRYDVKGAQAMGMKGIWKRVEGRPDGLDDYTITPDATITRIGELPDVLEKLYP